VGDQSDINHFVYFLDIDTVYTFIMGMILLTHIIFILYKLYILSSYTKPGQHRKLSA